MFGYAVILPLLLVTITLATRTYYGGHVLNIKTWAVVISSVAIVAGKSLSIHSTQGTFGN